MTYKDEISTLLVSFEYDDETCYQIDWVSGQSMMIGVVGCVFVEEIQQSFRRDI